MPKKLNKEDPTLYFRSFLLTLGIFFLAVAAYVLIKELPSISDFGLAMVSGIAIIGFTLILIGIFGSKKKVEKWANDASKHELTIILMLMAYPAYLITKKVKTYRLSKK